MACIASFMPLKPIKHKKPLFSFGKLELTRRIHWLNGAYVGPKTTLVGSPCAFKIIENVAFGGHNGQKSILMRSHGMYNHFRAPELLKSRNH